MASEAFHNLRQLSDQLSLVIDGLKNLPFENAQEKAAELKLALQSSQLGIFYWEEASRCFSVEAYFSAGACGSAAIESFLLARCAMEKDVVRALPDFNALPKKFSRNYERFLHSQDLGKLLNLAKQLKWLKVDSIPRLFETHILQQLDPQTATEIRTFITSFQNIGDEAAQFAKRYRDMLHPSLCIRENAEVDSNSGLTGCFFILLAVSALIESMQQVSASSS